MDPPQPVLTKDLFVQSACNDIIANCDEPHCSAYCTCFGAHLQAPELDDNTRALYTLLRDITSLYFTLDRRTPFGPKWHSPQGRSAHIDDFDDSHLAFLSDIVDEVPAPDLQARIADILWCRQRDHRMAQRAVTAYLQSITQLQELESWVKMVWRMERAFQIAYMLGQRSDSYTNVVDTITDMVAAYDTDTTNNLFVPLKLLTLLCAYGEGDVAQNIARTERLATQATTDQEWHWAREYWQLNAAWHRRADEVDANAVRAAQLAEAETYESQADAALAYTPPSHLHAVKAIQGGIEAFRRIGQSRDRIDELHARLLDYQQRSVAELTPLPPARIDLTDYASAAEAHVQDKSFVDAVMALATITPLPRVTHLREQAQRMHERYIAKHLFPMVFVNAMGQVIAHQPENAEEALCADMFQHAAVAHTLLIHAVIEPARKQIDLEHPVRMQDFLPMLIHDPRVPPGREIIIAHGLHAGLVADSLTAVHLLIPQLEASLRYVLAQRGILTSKIKDEGIQEAYNMNRLLTNPICSEPLTTIFGEDLIFDMRGLLVERFGANLRNDMAHGLIDYDYFDTPQARYLWWLSLCFYTLPLRTVSPTTPDDPDEPTTDHPDGGNEEGTDP